MDVVKALLTRRSVREYTDKKISDETILKILDCGNNAPVSGELHFTVITNKDVLDEMDIAAKKAIEQSSNEFLKERISTEGYRLDYNAPCVIIVSSTERPYKEVNGACAVTNICNAAMEYNLGSCFLAGIMYAFTESPELKKKIEIPDKFIPQFAVCLGHSNDHSAEKILRDKNYNYFR